MIDYTKHHVSLEDMSAVMDVLESDHLTQGPKVAEFEEAFAAVCNAKYAVAVSSGTAALHLAMLSCGVGPGKTVLTSPISFVATANAALCCGADVKFGDVNPENGLLGTGWHLGFDVAVPVSLGGNPLWAEPKGARMIYDFCHGPFGLPPEATAVCYSLHPAKHVAAGEGGVVVTDHPLIDVAIRQARDHGVIKKKMWHMGWNYRLSDINAALALSQLKRLDWNIDMRYVRAHRYDEAFEGKVETVPHSPASARHLYQVLLDNRNDVQAALKTRGIGTAVHYPVIPLQPYYRERFGYKPGDFPNAEKYAARTLSIPLYPTLTEQEQDYVIQQVLEVV